MLIQVHYTSVVQRSEKIEERLKKRLEKRLENRGTAYVEKLTRGTNSTYGEATYEKEINLELRSTLYKYTTPLHFDICSYARVKYKRGENIHRKMKTTPLHYYICSCYNRYIPQRK